MPETGKGCGGEVNKHIVRVSEGVIRAGLFLLVSLVPIAIWWGTTTIIIVKLAITQLLVSVMLLAWLVKVVEEGKLNLAKTPLNIPLLLFLVLGFISFMRSDYPHTSIRELAKLTTYIAIYFLVVNHVKSSRQVKHLLATLFLVATLISIYGILQRFGIDFLPRRKVLLLHERVISTLGHHNFMAAYLVLIIPLALGALLGARKRYERIILGVSIVLMFIALRYSYSRSGWVGFLAAILVVGMLLVIKFKIGKKKALLILISLLILSTPLVIAKLPKLQRELTTIRGVPIKARLLIYQGTLSMIKERPLLGSGIGNFSIFYPEYRRPEQTIIQPPQEIMVKHAHNEFLEMGAEMGLIGMALFLWIVVAFFKRGFSYFKSMSDTIILGCLAGLAGILVTNLISVNLRFVSSAVLFWFILGLTMALGERERER